MCSSAPHAALLAPQDPPPYTVVNPEGRSPVVLICDHASNRVPRKLADLGLTRAQLASHIAWDPGAALVAAALSRELDAALVLSGYSRLVIDCNRPLANPTLVAECSDGVAVPGNRALPDPEREARIDELFLPYHDAVETLLRGRGRPTLLLSIHSFTPHLDDETRPWHIGVACYRDEQLASALFRALAANEDLVVGFNQPYPIEAHIDYSIPTHGEGNGLPSAMVEIRQDRIAHAADAAVWAQRLARACGEVVPTLAHR